MTLLSQSQTDWLVVPWFQMWALCKAVNFSESRTVNACFLPRVLRLLALTQALNFLLDFFLYFSCCGMSNHWLFSLYVFDCFRCLRLTFQRLTLMPTIQCFQVPVAHHFLHIVRLYSYFTWFVLMDTDIVLWRRFITSFCEQKMAACAIRSWSVTCWSHKKQCCRLQEFQEQAQNG